MWRKAFSVLIALCLLFQQTGLASVTAELNLAGHLNQLSAGFRPDIFRPVHIRFCTFDALNDNIKVMLDKGNVKGLTQSQLSASTQELLNYFLIGVSLPNDTFWVNLRPDSEKEIIADMLAKTDIGKIMLETDLQLKKDTAQFTSPQTPEGRVYWDRLYKKAEELFGYDNVTIPTLTRPWIIPNEIIVRETKDSAYIYKATLKVMLEQDYLKDSSQYNFKDPRSKALNEYSSQLIRELIIPKLTKEVNLSKRYAPLRQVYYSLILSRWFKSRFANQGGQYASRIDKQDLSGLTSQTSWSKTSFFNAYKQSFSQGEYNIQETVRTPTGQVIRTYFSGGEDLTKALISGPSINGPSLFDALKKVLVAPPGTQVTRQVEKEKVIGAGSPVQSAVSPVKVAINNPGSQERELIRQWLLGATDGIELVGVNGIPAGELYYLLTKDPSASRAFNAITDNWFLTNYEFSADGIVKKATNELVLPVSNIQTTDKLPWNELKAEVVVEGKNPMLAASHKAQGAQAVIVSHPALTAVTALMPVLSVFDATKISAVSFTDVQPNSSLQRGPDGTNPDPVLGRYGKNNIVVAFASDSKRYAQQLLPAFADKIVGEVHLNPTPTGALLDVTLTFKQAPGTKEDINKLFKAAAEGSLKGKLLYSEDTSLVSVDLRQEAPIIFQAHETSITGRMVELHFLHSEGTAYAVSQLPLLLEAIKQNKVSAPDNIITSKDAQLIQQGADEVVSWARQEVSKMARPRFLDVNKDFVPSNDGGTTRPKLRTPRRAVMGLNGPGRTGRSAIWGGILGNPNVDLRMINGATQGILSLAWLLAEDSIQQSLPKPTTRVILTPAQLKKEVETLLGSYTVSHVEGFLTSMLKSERLAVLEESEFDAYVKKLLVSWGNADSEKQLQASMRRLRQSLLGVLDLNGKKVLVTHERNAISEIPWDVPGGIKTILECTGGLKNANDTRQHLANLKDAKVVISAPADGAGRQYVLRVVSLDAGDDVVDNTSCTTNCLLPIDEVLRKKFGRVIVQKMLTVHAGTGDQVYYDEKEHKKARGRGRDGSQSTFFGDTGAAKTAGNVIPGLASDGYAVRVPIGDVSFLALHLVLPGQVSEEAIKAELERASKNEMAGILGYTTAPVVATSFLGNPGSSIVDGNSIRVISYDEENDETNVRIGAYYSNEIGSAIRLVDLAVGLDALSENKPKISADIGPETVALFKKELKARVPANGIVIWNGPMGRAEAEATRHGTDGVADAILDLGEGVTTIVGGGDTVATLSPEKRKRFTFVSTAGGAFVESFIAGVAKLFGIEVLIDPATGDIRRFKNVMEKVKKGDRVFIREDHNVPLDSRGEITDDTRIVASLPSIKAAVARGAKVILATHLGRPDGKPSKEYRTDPLAKRVQEYLPETKVHKLPGNDIVGPEVENYVKNVMQPGEVLYLENLRFVLAEEKNGKEYAEALSRLADFYINDAFAVSHRKHASVHAITQFFSHEKIAAGLLVEQEFDQLSALQKSDRPIVVVIGGSKVTTKRDIIDALGNKALAFFVGGKMAHAFLAAQGVQTGDSISEEGEVAKAREYLASPKLVQKIILPIDSVVVSNLAGDNPQVMKGSVPRSNFEEFEKDFNNYLASYAPELTAESRALAAAEASSSLGEKALGEEAQASSAMTPTASSAVYSLDTQLSRLDKFVNANRGKGSVKGVIEEIYASVYTFLSKTATIPSFGVGMATKGATGINEVAQTGTSAGSREPITLSKKDAYQTEELKAFDNQIKPLLLGRNVADILSLDRELEAVGRSLKPSSKHPDLIYAGPAITATSMAILRALARSANVDEEVAGFWVYNKLAKEYGAPALTEMGLPIPMAKGNDGGMHGDTFIEKRMVDGELVEVKLPVLPYQEFIFAPIGYNDYFDALKALRDVTETYYKIIKDEVDKNFSFGAEAAIKSNKLRSIVQVLGLMTRAIKETPGAQGVFIARDDAASELSDHPGKTGLIYLGEDGKKYMNSPDGYVTTTQKIEFDIMLNKMFPRQVSLEDLIGEKDRAGWIEATKKLGDRVLIIGDDVFVTAPEIIEEGVKDKVATAVLDKLNQAATFSRAIKAHIIARILPVRLHQALPWLMATSHRSGEPAEQNMMAVLAIAAGSEFIKTTYGSIAGGGQGREAKVNFLSMTAEKWRNRGMPLKYAGARMLNNPERGFEKIVKEFTEKGIYTEEDVNRMAASPLDKQALENQVKNAFNLLTALQRRGELSKEQIQALYNSTWPIRAALVYFIPLDKKTIRTLGDDHMLMLPKKWKGPVKAGIQAWARLIDADKAKAKSYLKRFDKLFPTAASSALTTKDGTKRGGIDFKNKPMTINYEPMGNFSNLKLNLPTLSQAELERFDIDTELTQLERMVDNEMPPSGERILELLAACKQKGVASSSLVQERVMVLLVKIGILEETACCLDEASREYKQALVLAEDI